MKIHSAQFPTYKTLRQILIFKREYQRPINLCPWVSGQPIKCTFDLSRLTYPLMTYRLYLIMQLLYSPTKKQCPKKCYLVSEARPQPQGCRGLRSVPKKGYLARRRHKHVMALPVCPPVCHGPGKRE